MEINKEAGIITGFFYAFFFTFGNSLVFYSLRKSSL